MAEAKELKPDLILMDVNMPGKLNGVEAAFAIKNDPETQNIRIAFLSGSEDPWPGFAGEKSSVSKAIGMEDFIPKTTELSAILARVRALLAEGIPIPVPIPPSAG